MRKTSRAIFLAVYLAVGIMASWFVADAWGDEDRIWKHFSGSVGPIMWSRHCGLGFQANGIDQDNDGTLDYCQGFVMAHGKFHVTIERMPTIDTDGKTICSCEILNQE